MVPWRQTRQAQWGYGVGCESRKQVIELTEVNWVRPMLGGRVPQERKHGLCNLSRGLSSITYCPGDLQQVVNHPQP